MKRIFLPVLALVLALGLALPMATPAAADMANPDLIAGQNIDGGDVKVWNDTSNLYVQYVIDSPWVMTQSHLYVGKTAPTGFPSTPGQFPYSLDMNKSPSPGASYDGVTMTYTIPLAEIYAYEFVGKGEGKGLNAKEGTAGVEPCVDDVYIAAHADLEELSGVMTATLVSDEGTDSVLVIAENTTNPGYPLGYPGPYVGDSTSAILTWKHGSWPMIGGAQWISSAYYVEEPVNDSWRLFTRSFDVPSNAINLSGTLQITADNAEEVALNGSPVGSDGEVYGLSSDNQEWKTILTHAASPQPGTNTLEVMMRNYALAGGTVTSNPTGLIYSLDYEYQLLFTETGWAEGDPFGNNWAMYFSYHIQDIVEETYPDEGNVYIGYEDWGNGDFDYNDFGMYFSAVETYQWDGGEWCLTQVSMTFTAQIFDSGGTHLIHITRNINGASTYTVGRGGAGGWGGETAEGTYTGSGAVDVVLFDTAKYTWPQKKIGETVTVVIVVGNPSSNPKGTPAAPRWDLNPFLANYDPWEVGTSGIINGVAWHIGDMQTVSAVNGSQPSVLDYRLIGQTLPYILVVPSDAWIPAWEDSSISGPRPGGPNGPYDHFYDCYSTTGSSYPDWYDYTTDTYVGLGGLSWTP